jgi:hypothetical protein
VTSDLETAELSLPPGEPEGELELRFLGPLITVRNVEEHLPLLAHVFGLEARAIQELDAAEVRALWGIEGRSAGSVLLETGDSRVGVRLVQFGAPDSGRDAALFSEQSEFAAARDLRFLTRDFEVARHLIERAGFAFRSVSRFSAAGFGRFTEARFQGPDGISFSVLRMHDHEMKPWVRVADRLFGELLSVTIAAPDPEGAAGFFELLGLRPVSGVLSTSWGGEPVGSDAAAGEIAEPGANARVVDVRESRSFGNASRAPLITLVGDVNQIPAATLEEALVSQCGVVALRFECASVERVRRRLWSAAGQRVGARVLSLGKGILEPIGPVESMLVRAPGGMLHQFVGRM